MATSATSGLALGIFRTSIGEALTRQRGLVDLEVAVRAPWPGV